ncbi:MAG: formylmethanofuran dehydrogenase [Desulfobacterales bacterium]|nr:MAG: formylmethanofuran dehydrogenase [Desulfobacterales bacterium]
MIIPEKLQQQRDYQSCVAFHGHTCMGLTIGYMAAKLGLKILREERAIDEELVCITENDACCCDAIQVLTGCTFGKGNLIHRDIGKMAFTFGSRTTGEGIRLVLRQDIMDPPAEERALLQKMENGSATAGEIRSYQTMHQQRSDSCFAKGPEGFFSVEDTKIPLPDKARIAPSRPCAICGEATMETRLELVGSKSCCRDCARQLEL